MISVCTELWPLLVTPSCEINVSFLLCQNYWRAVLSFCRAAGAAGQLWILSGGDERKHQASYNWGICTGDFTAPALRVTCFALTGAKIISASSTIVKVFTQSLQMGRDGQFSYTGTPSPELSLHTGPIFFLPPTRPLRKKRNLTKQAGGLSVQFYKPEL